MATPNHQMLNIVRQYLGDALTEYSLNCNIPFVSFFPNSVQSVVASFTPNQIQALNLLYNMIQEARHTFIEQNNFGDGFLFNIVQYPDIFSNCRSLCGANIPNIQSNDPLLEFMYKIALKFYPFLLIKPMFDLSSFPLISQISRLFSKQEMEQFVTLVKHDVLNKLTNSSEDFITYAFNIKMPSQDLIKQVSISLQGIIFKCFQNCCYKMKYDFDNFIQEINITITKLRNLAEGQKQCFSIFVGAPGLSITDADTIQFDNWIIRPIRTLRNPSRNVSSTASMGQNDNIHGAIIEIFYDVMIKQQPAQSVATLLYTTTANQKIIDLNQYIEKCLGFLKFSICFGVEKDYAFVDSFIESGFPLIDSGNFSSRRIMQRKFTNIDGQANIDKIVDWYNRLYSMGDDINYVKIPLDRLSYAIHERDNSIDGFVDALIAWESLFSGTPETTFKVTGTITKFLNPPNKEAFFKELNALYASRSNIVHGGNSKINQEQIERFRARAVEIGLNCLRQLIEIGNQDLLRMTPNDRCKAIMVYDRHQNLQPTYVSSQSMPMRHSSPSPSLPHQQPSSQRQVSSSSSHSSHSNSVSGTTFQASVSPLSFLPRSSSPQQGQVASSSSLQSSQVASHTSSGSSTNSNTGP